MVINTHPDSSCHKKIWNFSSKNNLFDFLMDVDLRNFDLYQKQLKKKYFWNQLQKKVIQKVILKVVLIWSFSASQSHHPLSDQTFIFKFFSFMYVYHTTRPN